MRLVLQREQRFDAKLPQGAIFRVSAKLELTEEEKQLIERYKIDSMSWKDWTGWKDERGRNDDISIARLAAGLTHESDLFGVITRWHRAVSDGCSEMAAHVKAISSFGGVTTVDL